MLPASIYAELAVSTSREHFSGATRLACGRSAIPGIQSKRDGTPTTIRYVNTLPTPAKGSRLAKLLTVDQTIHWADPEHQMGSRSSRKPYIGSIPAVPHLHGAVVPSASDGFPEAWFTADGRHGPAYSTVEPTSANAATYRYPNAQPATALWFHDHALGLTRINVFAGLAAFYLVRDAYDTGLANNPMGLPAGDQEIELLIQDRQFDVHGQLLFPNGTPDDNPVGLNGPPPNPSIHPWWIPEFFGDVMVVNGKSWPYLEVEPRRYRFRVLNGCNARFLQMRLVTSAGYRPGPAIWQVGTDGGLLDRPVKLLDSHGIGANQLFLAPAERADVIVDFSSLAGQQLTLVNSAPAPYPDGDYPDPSTNGHIMQIRVTLPASARDTTYDPASGAALRGGPRQRPAIVRLVNPASGTLAHGVVPSTMRRLVLVEVEGPGGPIEVLVNNTKWTGLREGTSTVVAGARLMPPMRHVTGAMEGMNYLTELPRVGSTELWEIINLTDDAHPIHLHLIQFQLMNRQYIDSTDYRYAYDSAFPGGQFAGLEDDGSWGSVHYEAGTYIPGYGPPLPYAPAKPGTALGGNPDVTPYLVGAPLLPDGNEAGWKDTIKVFPGQLARIVARWAPTPVSIAGVRAGTRSLRFRRHQRSRLCMALSHPGP